MTYLELLFCMLEFLGLCEAFLVEKFFDAFFWIIFFVSAELSKVNVDLYQPDS